MIIPGGHLPDRTAPLPPDKLVDGLISRSIGRTSFPAAELALYGIGRQPRGALRRKVDASFRGSVQIAALLLSESL